MWAVGTDPQCGPQPQRHETRGTCITCLALLVPVMGIVAPGVAGRVRVTPAKC